VTDAGIIDRSSPHLTYPNNADINGGVSVAVQVIGQDLQKPRKEPRPPRVSKAVVDAFVVDPDQVELGLTSDFEEDTGVSDYHLDLDTILLGEAPPDANVTTETTEWTWND